MITKIQPSLIPQADTYFTNGVSNGTRVIHGPDMHRSITASFSSVQQLELAALIHLL